ncbi:hypothetical protein B9Z55_001996 [Caenorhabditis nigoni]|uniref:Calponin-homology (CH) domain-containing protein n=1 Tax=Caenorhabditis nigoni TaxID=1611254 RepID=A0A2G5VI80_9PELO|nr:hypothetical protein B9Z55_001996 [Caenorhabditis nigoni]
MSSSPPARPCCVCFRFRPHEDEKAQKNTFTRWINFHLEEHSSSGRIEDLFEDIRDGVLLCHLIEVLTGEALAVHKGRVSKRVHHIANLTTALTVLRRRGLELINNNAADIADGNPRIVLGLIWQIILHFQIETNMILLREWGWAATATEESASTSQPQVLVTSPSPTLSKKGSKTSSLSGSKTSIASGEKAPSSPLRQRIASFLTPTKKTQKMTTHPVKQSVEQVFLRWINSEIGDLVGGRSIENMDKQWRDGVLFCALVSRWRPDVISMREVTNANPRDNLELAFNLAHQHLGIRRLLAVEDMMIERPDKRSVITYVSQFVRMFGERSPMQGREQHAMFLTWLEATYLLCTRHDLNSQEVSRIRREFIEHRPLFNTIIVTKVNYDVEELVEIEKKWDCIRETLEKYARRSERELPEPFASHATWLAGAEHILSRPLDLDANDAKKTVGMLQKLISEHQKYLEDLPKQRDEFEEAVKHGGLGGRPVAPEFSEPLRARYAQIEEENEPRISTLRILITHYILLQYLQHIDEKIILWRTADSVTLLLRWIKEYTQLNAENPQAKCAGYINKLTLTMNNDNSSKLDKEAILKTSNERTAETLKRFESLWIELKLLKIEWVEWETHVSQLEETVEERRRNGIAPTPEDEQALAFITSGADQLAPKLGASARLSNNQRLDVLTNSFKKLHKTTIKIGGRLVVELEPSTSEQASKISYSWQASDELLKVEMQLRDRIQRDADSAERAPLEYRVEAFRSIRDKLVELERLSELYDKHSRDQVDTADRNMIRRDMGTIIYGLQAGEYASFVDLSCYAFVYDEYNQVPVNLTENVLSEEYVREIIARKRQILIRREHNEDEIRESMRDMEECDRIIEGWQSSEIEELRATWNQKLSEFESWHEMMQQVEVLSQTIQTRLDVTVIQTIWILKERSYEIKHSELGGALRESLEQLATTSETSVHRHLQNLELSNEQDCPDAIEFLEEVGRESVAKLSSAVDERYIYTLHVLRTKMELFRRLQNFCDAVKILRSQNTKWNAIKISQIDQVQSEINNLIVRLDEEWTQDANQLRTELASIHGSFFQLEFDRLNEKLNMLIHEKDKLRELMVHRRHYLTAANELIADSKTDLTQRATSSDHPDDILRATDEVTKDLEIKGEELRRLGELAEMNITDLVVVALILSFRRQQLGSDAEPDVEELRRALREIISRPISEPRDVSPDSIVADILRMKDEKKRDEKTIDEIQATTLTDEERASFAPLIEDYRRRADRHRIVFERLVLIYLDWLSRKFDELEEEIGMTIQTSRAEDLRRMNATEWNEWKTDLVEIERQVGPETRKSLSAELADLHRKQDSMEARINKYLTHSDKINAKLSQFEKWLKAIEEDIQQTERQFEEPERSHRFGSLLEVALAKQRLVSKLERLNVANKEEVLRLCDRYHTIMQKLTPFQSAVGLPLHVSTNLDRNGPFQSQISVSSIASSELERPESVMSLTSSIGVIPADVTELSPFEAKINKLLQKIHTIEDSYLKGPKPIDTVRYDVKQLEKYRSRGSEILQQLSTSNIEDAEKEGLKHRFVLMLNRYDDLLQSIRNEIRDDEELTAKNVEILAELSNAEQTLQNSPLEDLDISAELDRMQMQLDLVKVMCNKPRKYVECELIDSSREGSPQERRRRKKKVMVMVSNTITTIIHVVEERLEAMDAPQNLAVQQKLVAVKENLRELDTATVTPHPPSIMSPVGTENRNDLDEVKRLAAEIDRAINTASSMYEDSPTDEDTLKSAIHLLDDQKVTLNHLNDVLDGIPVEQEQDRIDAIDIACSVGEKLSSLKTAVEEVYEEVISSAETPQEDQSLQKVQEVGAVPAETSNWDTDEFSRQPPVLSDERIELKTDPSAIDKFEIRTDEDPVPKIIELFGQLQTAVDEASPLACEGTDDVDALQVASDKLTKQDRTMRKIHAILDKIDDPVQKPVIIESLDKIKSQLDQARENINRQIDNLNYNQTPVVAPKESSKTPLNEIEDAIKQASTVMSVDLCNTEKLLNAKSILANVKPQVDAVEADIWSNPETIDIVQPILQQYATLIESIDKKISDEIDVPINDPSRQDLVQQLQDVIAECEDVVIDCEDIGRLEESKTKLENAKPLLDQIVQNVEKLTREQSPDASDAIDALSNVHQQYDATIISIEDKIGELQNPEPVEEGPSASDQLLSELEVISDMPSITIDLAMLDSIESGLVTLPTDQAEKVQLKINELRQKKEIADQSEAVLADLNAFSELPAITLDLELLKSVEEGLVSLPADDAAKIQEKISELRKRKEKADEAEAVLQELHVISDLPASTIDLDMLQAIEDNLVDTPEEEKSKILEKINELRERRRLADQTDEIVRELDVTSELPATTIDLDMLKGIEDNLSSIPEEDAEKIRDKINELRKQKESAGQAEQILQELNVISETPSSTIDLDMLKAIEDGLSSLPHEEAARIQTEIDYLRQKKQGADEVENALQVLTIQSSQPAKSIDLEELKQIENKLNDVPVEDSQKIRDKIADLRTEKALAEHAENYLIELKKIEEMPISTVGYEVLSTIEDQIAQMPKEYQSVVTETLKKLKEKKEEDDKLSGVYDELERIAKLPAKDYDNSLLEKIDEKLEAVPKPDPARTKIEDIKITKADLIAEIEILDKLPAKDVDENILNSIEEKLPTIPSDSSDQLQIAIGKLREKKRINTEEGNKILNELAEIEKMPAESLDESVLKMLSDGSDIFEPELSEKIKQKVDAIRAKKTEFKEQKKEAEHILSDLEKLSAEEPLSLTEDRLAPFLQKIDTVPACFVDKIRNKIDDMKKIHDEAVQDEKEEQKEILITKMRAIEKSPIESLNLKDLDHLNTKISESLAPEEAEPLLAKIQELRDAKRADDEARSAAHDNLVSLEKEAEDVTAKESAKKKKKDKKKSPQEMIDELSAKVVEAKTLIPKIEEAAKNEHLPAEDKPKAEQLVSNLEAFVKDVETQVSEKQDELDKLNNANDAIKRLGDALDDAEKTAVPSNVTALNEFKDRIAPHIATLVEAVQQVPVSVEPSAAALRDRAAKFVSDLEKNIEKTGDDEKRAEQLKSDVGNAVNNVDDVVSKYHNQTQPLDVAKEDANKLKTAVEQLTKLAESSDKIDPQVAKDIKDSKTKAKELLQALEKAIPQEDVIRREQAEIHDRLNNLEKELTKVDEFKPEDALPVVDQLASDTTTLKAVTDSNNEKAAAPSSLISHDDLVVGLPEKVFQLQHAIDDKKQALNKAAAVNEIAPKLQLVSQQLQSVPQDIPASLDEQKQLLEDVENQKHNLENLLANLPENDPAADELRQKSQWDLSRLEDLLKQLGSAVGDKLAALAAFNAARKNAEDALLDITREDGSDDSKSPDELIDDLTKKEETVAKLRETVAGVKPDELDEKERAEYKDLLARLANAADVFKNKRAELEQALKAKAEEKSLHDAVDRIVSRLVPLVRDAEELRHNAEAVPTQYAPKAEELKKEVEAAKTIIVNAPTSDAHVQQLQQAVANAETLIPDLEERARLWEEFLVARNDIDALIEKLQQPLDAVVAKPKRSAEEATQDVANLRQSAQQLADLDNKIANLQRISELLDPLESAYADVRFLDVDAEQTRHQYDTVLSDVDAELEDETLLKQSADQVTKEIDDISKMIDSTDPEKSILDTIAKSDIPALKAQINRIKDRIVNADASRKHVTTDPKIAEDLENKLAKLEAELDDAIKTCDEHDKEQLILSLKLNISQFEQLPLDQLKPDDLKTAEKEITNSLKPEEAEPLLAKIQELRDAKRADDEARSAAHDNLVSLEKEAEDVTAKESAKKKKKDKKKSPQEMIDELSAKVVEAKALIPKIEEAAKNEHLPAEDKPKAEQLVSNLEAFVKDVETQVSEKQDELDKLNNANDAIKRLGDALDDAEKTAVPSNVTALNEFKDRIASHIATLVEAVQQVPVSVEPSAADLRDRAAKFVSDLEKNIEKTGDDEKRAEQLKSDVGNAVNNVDDVVSKYHNQTQPLDVAKEDANKLKTAVEQLTKLAESSDKIDPQVAKDIKDSKTKAKELLQALEKAIPQEDVIRREQAEIHDRLNNLEKELAKVDEFKPEDALPVVDQLASDTTTLKAVTDSNNEKAAAPSSLISHDDLVVGLPEKVFQLQHAIDDKKQALNKAAAVNEIAPKLQLVSQQLQSVPQDIPASLDEQKQLLEDVENQKHNLENLLANLPENDPAADELRQKSQWDLSRLKDLLKQLGSAVGDKLAALAAFNAARKNAEDALLDITREDGSDDSKSPDELIDDLTKKEETVAKLRETVAGVKPDELDEKERAEYKDLLARLANAADVLKNKRAELEQALKAKAEEKSLHDAVDRIVSRLVPLVRDAEELRHNAEAVPTQYAPKAEELKKEVEAAKTIIVNAPTSDAHVQQLQQAVANAETLIPDLEERARLWEEFLVARNDIDALTEKLQQPLDAVVAKPKRSAEEATQDVANLRQSAQQLADLDNKIANLQRISELLDPLESAYADVRFLDVDAEQTRHQYDTVLSDVDAELEDETLLKQSADQVTKEIDDISKMIDSTDPEKSILDTIAKSDIPALKAQINRIKDRIVNADASRKHVTTDPKIAEDLENKLAKLEAELDDAIKTCDEHDKEQLILSLKLNISQFEQLPLDQLKPDDLKTAEKEITNSLKPEEAEPLLAKIQELRDAKRADDEARSAAHDNLVSLEKEAEDVTAKESAKKKKKDKKKSPQEMIDELSAKVVEAKALIPKIEEAAKNEHLPAEDKPKAEQLVSNLEAFVKDVETQVSEKQDELDKLNNANDAIKRLGDALDDAEKTAVPSNVTALNEFKDRIAPHIATLVEAVQQVPVSVEPSAAALRDRAAKFVSDLEKNIEKTGDDEKRAEQLKSDVGNAVNNVDDVVSKYHNQTQPLDVAKEDANKLKTAVEQLTKLAESSDKIDPQVAKDIKDSKTKAKELLQALEKAIPQEDVIRREQAEIHDRLNNLEKELAKVDEFKPEDALPVVDQLASDTTTLKAVTDSNNEKAAAPSSLISHDDLVVGLPEKVFQLQHAIDDKKQALNKAAAVNEIAPKLQLVSQQLQSVPQDIPASLDEQKQLLEDVENQKHNLENLLANLPENDPAADELRQKSQWDLSRLKDLLKQLGSAVGDKLAALAAFNAARKNAEDALLDITREDGSDDSKSPDELIDDLTKKEETVAKLRETVAGVKPDELDEKERAEYKDLLARLANAADVLKNKRAELEQALKAKAEEKSLHDAVDRIVSRLVPLVRDAEELRHNAEAVPTQYAPKAEELKKEVEAAKTIIVNAPTSDAHVQQLQQAVANAETLIPDLEERARLWEEFLVARNDIDALIEKLQQPLDAVVAKPKRSAEEATQDVANLRQSAQQLADLDNKIANLQRISELLDPLESAYADVRFLDVDAEQTRHQYDTVLSDVDAELEDETLLKQSADQVTKEIDDISKMIDSTDPEKSILDTIAKSDIPALKAQINRIKDRIVNADASRKHVTTDPKIAEDLENKLAKLEAELDDAIKTCDEHDKEQLILSLKLNISQFEQLPLDQLKPDDLKTAEKEITNSLKPEEAEPLLAKIQELRDAKRADDEARSAAHDNLVSLEKEAEDVTAKESAKKKKKDKKKSPQEMIDELSAKVVEAKALIPKIEEAAKNEHLPAEDKPKAEQLVSNLEAFVKDVETQVSEKQDELDKLNNANDAIKRLGDALDDAEKTAVPSNVTALNEFKDRIAPHIATLVEAVQQVPVSVEPSAAALRDRAAKFVSDLEKNIEKTGDDEKRAEQLKSDVGNAVNNVDDVVSKYHNQTQPLDVAKEDANKLKTAVEQLTKLAESSDKIDPQVAKDIIDSKTKAKELLQALEKPSHRKMLSVELAKVDEFKPEDALPVVDQLASDTTTLKAVTDSNNEKAAAPSSLISHDDLVVGLPEKVFQLQHAIDDKKQALNKAAAVNEIAPKLQLVSQQLQSDVENQKHNLENLLANLPENDPAADELRQKSQWDLSRLKDLLKQLGSAVGDKLAALAAFNAARKNAEDALLDITREDGSDDSKSPDELIDDLTKKEETVAKLRETVAGVKPDELDEKERAEYKDLLARLANAADVLKNKRAELEQALKAKAEEKSLHDAVDRIVSRLVPLVRDAEELRHNAEAVPTQYAPKAEELKKEVEAAKTIIVNAPTSDAHVQQLQQAVANAETLIPDLEERARLWEEFLVARNDIDALIEKLQQPLDAVVAKPKRSAEEATQDVANLRQSAQQLADLDNKIANLQRISELLDPLESAYADVRFLDVDAEQTRHQYDTVLSDVDAELEDETLLKQSADQVTKEIDDISKMIDSTDPEKSILDTIAKSDIPALKAQINRIKDRIFEQLPLDQLKPDDLKTAEKEITNSLKPEEAEPLLAKIQELRDAKRADDEARSAAHDNLVSLEKEAEDVTAKESAKKKKKDKKKSPQEMIDELSAKVVEAKALIPKIEEAAKNEHLPAEDKPKAEQLVSNLEAFVKDVETQVSEKQDELDKLNNANDAIKRLGDALDDAEKTAVPSNVTALNEFKDRIAPHIATLVEAVQQVPVSVEPSAAALRDRAAKFVSDLEKNIEKTGDDEKRAEQLKSDVGNAVNNVDDVVSKYHNQTQPLDVAKEDANKLKTAVEQLTKLAESSDKIDPQVAKDIKDSKTKAKELLQALEKAIPQEDVIRREQAEIHDRLNNLEKELAKVDEFKPEDALPVVDQLASDTTTLKAVTDSNNEKAAAPSSLISHDDLVVGLPEKVFQLQHAIDDKKQALNKAAAVNEIAPKLQLVSQQLQSVPQDIPASLDEQKQLLEDVENQKHNLENLLANLPENDPAADELRQKSQWDLSRLKDLLKQLGSAVGDKLAALAAFNAARKNAEDALLDITREDGSDDSKSPDELIDDLTKKEETVAKLRETVAGVKPDELDEKERAEYKDLLARLANAADVLKNKRAELEQALKAKAEEKSLHDAVDRIVSRLVPLVRDAEELRHNAEAVPTQYAPKAEELKKEVEAAKTIIVNAPTSDAHVQQLQQAVANAETLIPDLEERARLWEEFLVARNDIDALIEKLQQPLDAVVAKPKRSAEEATQDVANLRQSAQQLADLDNKIANLQRISELLDPLESAYADVRFLDVDAEQTRHQYDTVLSDVDAELEDETLLKQSADQVTKEIDDISKMIDSTDPEKSILDTIAKSDIPALKAQINRIKDRIVNADASRKHVTTDPKIAEDLENKLAKLEAELDDAIKTCDEHDKEQLILSLKLNISQFEQLPLDQLKPDDLKTAEKEITNSLKPEEAEPLLAKIQELRDAKRADDEARSAAHDNLVSLEKEAEDVTAKESAKKKKKDKKKSPQEMIDELSAKVVEAKALIPKIEEAAKNEHLPAEDKPKAEQLVSNLEAFVKDVETQPSAAALRDRAAKFVSDLEKNIEKTGDDEKRAEQLKSDVGNAVNNVDDVVSKYHNQTQPLDVAKEDANKLKTAVEQLTKLAESSDKIDPQVAKDIKDSKTKAKELLQALEKAIPQEDVIRREQAEIHDRLNNLEKELAKVDEFKPEDALPVVDQLASDTTTLKAVTDSNNEKAAAPSSLISHDDLVVGLPEKVFQLQHAIDDKKQALNKAAAVNEIAPKLQLVSQQLQSVPQDIPASLDEQKQLLEDVENQKHNLENLLANLPENDPAADELRQKSQWDLSRLKDLLKQLGSAVGDKLAALAAFNAARKNAEDALLDITREDGSDDSKSPE